MYSRGILNLADQVATGHEIFRRLEKYILADETSVGFLQIPVGVPIRRKKVVFLSPPTTILATEAVRAGLLFSDSAYWRVEFA